jgi:hypothetical protein
MTVLSSSYSTTASYALSAPSEPLPEIWQHPATLTGSQYTVKADHNGMLLGNVSMSGSIDILPGGQLVIIPPQITGSNCNCDLDLANKNYASDAEAAAAGIPLWGIYRSGNMVVVRISDAPISGNSYVVDDYIDDDYVD